jgi:hypothetical protein
MTDNVQRIAAAGTSAVRKVTIPINTALSEIADLGGMRLAAIGFPAAWTAASLTFKAGYDGATVADLQDSTGTDYAVAVAAGKVRIVEIKDFLAFSTLQLQSGTTGAPVNQLAARDFFLYLVP